MYLGDCHFKLLLSDPGKPKGKTEAKKGKKRIKKKFALP